MNKKISTPIAIIIIVIFTLLISGFTVYQQQLLLEEILIKPVLFPCPSCPSGE